MKLINAAQTLAGRAADLFASKRVSDEDLTMEDLKALLPAPPDPPAGFISVGFTNFPNNRRGRRDAAKYRQRLRTRSRVAQRIVNERREAK